jgi:ATP-dependent DNA helicase HFM1/MER3
MIKLLMIDEVHLLNDSSRGHTLEAVVSRMKTISNSFREAASANPFEVTSGGGASGDGIRFIAVSATIPNVEDIAEWLGGGKETAAVHFKFGEEKRPVQLRKVVMGYPLRPGMSDFKFEMNLTYKVRLDTFLSHVGQEMLLSKN